MRYPIKITTGLQPLFRLFGFSPASSYLEIEGNLLGVHFGTAHETIPIADIGAVKPRRWPIFYGFGAKLGPRGSVAYVGSSAGVIEIELRTPRRMNVWGPFARREAKSIIVSLEDAERFSEDLARAQQ